MQSHLSRVCNDRLDGLASQKVEASSEVPVCLSVLSFYLAMWSADKKLEKQGLWCLALFSCAIKVFEVYHYTMIHTCLSNELPVTGRFR